MQAEGAIGSSIFAYASSLVPFLDSFFSIRQVWGQQAVAMAFSLL